MNEALIECRDVACGYDEPVLEHVDLRVERGEILVILGPSGGGKSTLLRTLIGLLPPLAGEVLLFGRPLYDIAADERRDLLHRAGVAFQQDALFESIALDDNVALPLRELAHLREPVIREMVRMRLGLVGLDGLEQHLPAELSGGQRKRAALARASIMDPELIACDEPTAGLDPVVAAGIDELLLRFRELLGMTLVVVSHELASIRAIATRAVMLAGGTVRAAGTVDELVHSRDREVFEFFHARPQ
ncbi:MAG TPA: ATP-binding cassette domain-containing protein [Kofleriaceae bacterium]|jgi:phospholipid/cholesterol/gamma-HCH transport system ATP-binding protein